MTYFNVNQNGNRIGYVWANDATHARNKATEKGIIDQGEIAEFQPMKYVYMGGGYCVIPA